jgi:NADH-quinone oxidoreductase subunit N
MLAYSTIAQMGWVLLAMSAGVVGGSTLMAGNAYSSAMFYVVSYVLTTLGTFGLILYLSRQGFEAEQIADFAGLGRRAPWVAGTMAIFMFSLAGVPPLVGFYAKLAVLQALVSTDQSGFVWLAVVAVLLSLVGAYYYIRVVKVMYFDEAITDEPIVRPQGLGLLLALNGAAVLGFGLLPGGLMNLCRDAIVKALST